MSIASRRRFLGSCAIFTAGATAGSLVPRSNSTLVQAGVERTSGAEARLRDLGIELRESSAPSAPFRPAVQVENILYLSGHGPRKPDGGFVKGKVGKSLSMEEAQTAARLTGLDMLSTIRGALGSLDKVERLVKVTGMVNSTDDFTQHPQVINGFSTLMIDVFGEQAGKGARSAVGMSGLPFGIAVEIEAVFQVRES
ncbi:MAG: RidA family protein [Fuerstiella sp.]|nr:RidA family protein [Fuerstiella sp.]